MTQSGQEQTSSIWTPSNVITVIRILLVPLFVAALLAPWPEWFGLQSGFSENWKSLVAAGVFVFISCTDWLDGYLARSRNEVTDFGKFMDPLADKILVSAALIALVELGSLPTFVVLVILAREFIVSGVRMMAATKGVVIAASMLGKFKTVFQMIAIVLFTVKDSHMIGSFYDAASDHLWLLSWVVMLIALGLTIASMFDYLAKARELIGLDATKQTGHSQEGPSEAQVAETQMRAEDIEEMARGVIARALEKSTTIATAESLTGGMISTALTAVPGSSQVFFGGVASYTDDVKREVLGVSGKSLEDLGAVSAEVAEEMARGVAEKLGVDVAVSVTGIAGPTGAEPGKPVGTVFLGAYHGGSVSSRRLQFQGSRADVRVQTTLCALDELSRLIK